MMSTEKNQNGMSEEEELELDFNPPKDHRIGIPKDPRYQQILNVCLGILKYGHPIPIEDLVSMCASRGVGTNRDEVYHVIYRISNISVRWIPSTDSFRWVDQELLEGKGKEFQVDI